MKLNKILIIPALIALFALFGLEMAVLPYVPFGTGRWSDSLGTNVSNHNSRINGNLNVVGDYYRNGVLFGAGGTPITASEEGTEIEDEITGLDFVGNMYTVTTSAGSVTLTSTVDSSDFFTRFNLDTSDIAMQSQTAIFAGDVTANGFYTNGTMSAGELEVTNASYLNGAIIAGLGIQFVDATKVIVDFGNDILYKVSTGGAHVFQTASGTDLAKIDSSSGISAKIEGLSGIWGSEPMVRQKLIRGVTASAVNGTQTYAHNITNGRIIGMTATLRVDTSGVSGYGNDYTIFPFANTFMGTGYQWTAYFDSLNVGTKLGGSADAIKLDSVFFLLTYIIPG